MFRRRAFIVGNRKVVATVSGGMLPATTVSDISLVGFAGMQYVLGDLQADDRPTHPAKP